MKIKQVLLASAVLISTVGFAQKDEFKTLKKIYAKDQPSAKDLAEYNAAIIKAEPLVANSNDSDKIYFSFYKANTPMLELQNPENKNNPQLVSKNLTAANINAFATASNAVLELEKSDKKIHTADINNAIKSLKSVFLNHAIGLVNLKKEKEASAILYATYQLDKKDVDNLYYAANYAVNSQEYDAALKYYEELKTLKYSGDNTLYYAKNIVSDTEESFPTKAERDKMIALKLYSSPRDEKETSKRGEIYKNIALILVQQGKDNEAKAAIAEARKENPEDTSLMLTEADLYLKLEDFDTYKKLISHILEKNPNDADLTYNLGVITLNSNQLADAEKYFKRAIEINPKYVNAYINLAAIQLKSDKKLVDEMNQLGTSVKDNKRYEELKNERVKLFKSTLPNLEKAFELDSKNELVVDNLLSVYNFLEMTDKYKALKAKQ